MAPPSVTGFVWIGLLAAGVIAQQGELITDDTYFYGQVPATYPTPQIEDNGPWGEAVSRARALVSEMTLDEKVLLTGGGPTTTGCNGFIPGIERLGFPGLCLQDAGQGLRNTDYVSSFPAGMHVGASWNKRLAHARASALGKEARTKGVNVLLGPAIGPLGRVVRGGRNWEAFSIDPYLTGRLVYETVMGVQANGVITSTKHLVAQEQETHRRPTLEGPFQEAVSSNVDDKTMHELYLWPFYDAVRAGTGNVMCSYQRINNTYGCQNSAAQNGLLKGQLGFQASNAGLDVAMPSGALFWAGNLTQAVNNGSVALERLDDMVTRTLASWFHMGQDQDYPTPGYGIPRSLDTPHEVVDARSKCAKPVLFQGAVEGHVLVKNQNNALPLKSEEMKLISIFGYAAPAPKVNNILGFWRYGAQATNGTVARLGFGGPNNLTAPPIAVNGSIIGGGGSGATSQSLFSSPYDALVAQAYEDDTTLFYDFESGTPAVNPTSDACIIFGNVWASEGYDRVSLQDEYTDNLINHVAANCSNTIVVFQNAGTRLVDAFADHPNVTAIIFAHLGGQDGSKALVSLLYGKSVFSGKLPYTVAHAEADYGRAVGPDVTRYADGGRFSRYPQSDFTEGVFVDYRHFDAENIEPRYEFGFGLSYTTFDYNNLDISITDGDHDDLPSGPVVEGGQADLWDELVTVTADITNTGDFEGMEVAQLYLGIPGENTPVRQLRGFEKPLIAPGETVNVEFTLTRRDLSSWDVVAQKWRLQSGEYTVYVGRSSRDLPLQSTFTI
ncbi:hypothetical protein S7711_04459 [Stachybotrys chartarum IBT 7711]|uniref:Beta-glucosidase cel3A n=1 Tax=Stachybotrys chartarum (strain CBS 109288 / IBT 7711) TaxID=1280523 RepID=A0A084BA40_STACB|nr:hypothetical protein S7711_04459 [Stachybotrys chartarum IBT 7711]